MVFIVYTGTTQLRRVILTTVNLYHNVYTSVSLYICTPSNSAKFSMSSVMMTCGLSFSNISFLLHRCPRCLAHLNSISWATWAIEAAIKKCCLYTLPSVTSSLEESDSSVGVDSSDIVVAADISVVVVGISVVEDLTYGTEDGVSVVENIL